MASRRCRGRCCSTRRTTCSTRPSGYRLKLNVSPETSVQRRRCRPYVAHDGRGHDLLSRSAHSLVHRRARARRDRSRGSTATISRRRGAIMAAAADRCAATAISGSGRSIPTAIRSAGAALNEFALEARYRFGNFGIVPFIDAGNSYESSLPERRRPAVRRGDRRALLHQFRADAGRRRDAAQPAPGRRQGRALHLDRAGVLMADETSTTATDDRRRASAPLWQRILKWIGIAIARRWSLLVAIVVLGINTDPGRRFVADQIGGYKTATRAEHQGRADRRVALRRDGADATCASADPKGVFLTSPRLDVDWRPFAFASNHVDVRSLTTRAGHAARRPELMPHAERSQRAAAARSRYRRGPPADRPLRDRQRRSPGRRTSCAIDGAAHIADRRAQLIADAARAARRRASPAATADAAGSTRCPTTTSSTSNAKLNAPVGGVVATMGGLKAPLTATVDGQGQLGSRGTGARSRRSAAGSSPTSALDRAQRPYRGARHDAARPVPRRAGRAADRAAARRRDRHDAERAPRRHADQADVGRAGGRRGRHASISRTAGSAISRSTRGC